MLSPHLPYMVNIQFRANIIQELIGNRGGNALAGAKTQMPSSFCNGMVPRTGRSVI